MKNQWISQLTPEGSAPLEQPSHSGWEDLLDYVVMFFAKFFELLGEPKK